MDEAYQQHSPHSRRHNKSATSLNKLSLAPLTSKLPMDDDGLPDITPIRSRSPRATSYIESHNVAPTTGILSHPTSRSSSRHNLAQRRKIFLPKPGEAATGLTKSKSSTHIHISPEASTRPAHHKHKSGAMTPGPRPTYRHGHGHGHKSNASEDFAHLLFSPKIRDGKIDEDDWLLRTGSLLTHGARESKGQAWLVSRASSTSLTNQNNDSDSEDEEKREQEERILGLIGRRRESGIDADDEFSPVTTRSFIVHSRSGSRYNSVFNSRTASRVVSRAGSRVHSRRGSKVGLALTPSSNRVGEVEEGGYFDAVGPAQFAKPDFVGLGEEDEEEENEEAKAVEDEILVKRLVKTGLGTWVEKLLGWSLFDVEESGETEDEEQEDTETESFESHKEEERRQWKETLEKEVADQNLSIPAPSKSGDEGGWSDAAWLLSVATKVLL